MDDDSVSIVAFFMNEEEFDYQYLCSHYSSSPQNYHAIVTKQNIINTCVTEVIRVGNVRH